MLAIEKYDLQVAVSPPPRAAMPDAPGRIAVRGTLHFHNRGRQAVGRVSWILYRLLTVSEVADGAGRRAVHFCQRVQSLRDWPSIQVNCVQVSCSPPVASGEMLALNLAYSGPVVGYREAFPYVHDAVERDRTLLRREVLWYPVSGFPTWATYTGAWQPRPFDVTMTLPSDWWGCLLPGSTVRDGPGIWRWQACSPGAVLVAGRYAPTAANTGEPCTVRAFTGQGAWASHVQEAAGLAVERLTPLIGPSPRAGDPWQIIEVPDHWGSEAMAGAVLMEHHANPARVIRETVHEVAHRWALGADPHRFCDESLVS